MDKDEEFEAAWPLGDQHTTFVPVGTVVKVRGGERPVVVAGVMVVDGVSGRYWDYLGYPYPEGRQSGKDYFFDNGMITDLLQLGYVEGQAMGFQFWLASVSDEYAKKRAAQDKTQQGH